MLVTAWPWLLFAQNPVAIGYFKNIFYSADGQSDILKIYFIVQAEISVFENIFCSADGTSQNRPNYFKVLFHNSPSPYRLFYCFIGPAGLLTNLQLWVALLRGFFKNW